MKRALPILGFLFLAHCTSKPILLPNAKYNKVGEQASLHDVDQCMDSADAHLRKTRGRRVLKGAATGAVIGAAVGGLGAGHGHVGQGLLAGGAIGAGAGALVGAFSTPEAAKHSLVDYCLRKKGYAVAGWD